MTALVELFTALGYTNVQTYIQSGNVVFDSPGRVGRNEAAQISEQIAKTRGFAPRILILAENDLRSAVQNNPFSAADGKTMHFFFLEKTPPQPNLDRLAGLKAASEEFALGDRVFYLLAPDGIGRSRLAPAVESALGVPVTARNWNTVAKLVAMVELRKQAAG
jgi:uncharacterized protein (DUF1697 family)